MRTDRLLLATLALCAVLAGAAQAAATPLTLYVATNGNDSWSGKLAAPAAADGPFATLERARDEIRKLKQAGDLPSGGVVVEIRGGDYLFSKSLELTANDSGTKDAPIVYRAYKGEVVRLCAGQRIPGFKAVTDPAILSRLDPSARGKVMEADLKALGITSYGQVPTIYRGQVPLLELFVDDQPMQLARWPNEGWWTIFKPAVAGSKPGPGNPTGTPSAFYYHGDRPQRWLNSDDVILRGYWRQDWYEEGQKIAKIDPQAKIITFSALCAYGIGGGLRRYYALNVLDEVDMPGEYYLDRKTGKLYFWPPADLGKKQVWVSTLPSPVVNMTNTDFVTLRGLTLAYGQGNAVNLTGCSDDQIVKCVIRDFAGAAVIVSKGTRCGVEGCDIYQIGRAGLMLDGGDRKTLTPGEDYADNNHIHHWARLERTYAGAIHLTGVGNRATHNLLHHAPHSAVFFYGNDHLIEFNEMHHLMLETHDAGACYMGRNFTCEGNMIRYNFIHHRGAYGIGSSGVYLDDGNAGNTIFGNIFYKGTWATVLGGSRDTKVLNNLFVDCEPAVNIDDRAYNHLGKDGQKGQLDSWTLDEVPYQQPPWSTRYPRLARILEDEPGEPKYNEVAYNVRYNGTWTYLNRSHKDKTPLEQLVNFHDNWLQGDPKFVDPRNLNFQLQDNSPVYKRLRGFQRIPVDKIGCYASADRVQWPIPNFQRDRTEPMQQDKVVNPPEAPWLKPAPLAAYRLTAPLVLDGQEGAGEWPASDAKPVSIAQTPDRTQLPYTAPHSLARVAYDDNYLYVLLVNQCRDSKFLSKGSAWGKDDGAEVCFQAAGKTPIYVIHGFANGKAEAVTDGGATAEQVKALAEAGLALKTSVQPDSWTAEFRIPLQAIGITPKAGDKLLFNIGIRQAAEDGWLAWAGTEAQNWRVDKAGELVFR